MSEACGCAENLAAGYVTIFGSFILRGLRIVQFNVDSVSASRVASSEQPPSAVKDRANLLILQRQMVVERLGKTSDSQRRDALHLELTKIDEALNAFGFTPARIPVKVVSTNAASRGRSFSRVPVPL
jgi:hypothetical protein